MTPRTRRNVSRGCKQFHVKRMRVKAIRFVCTRLLLYPGFHDAFVSFYPCVWFQWKKRILLLIYCLGVGLWSEKLCFIQTNPRKGKKHVYIHVFADFYDVPVIVII